MPPVQLPRRGQSRRSHPRRNQSRRGSRHSHARRAEPRERGWFRTVFNPEPAANTLSARIWLIRLVALTLLLAANALLQAAALQPAIVDGSAESRRIGEVLDGSVTFALLAAVLMVVSWRSRHDYWRVLLGVILAVGSILGIAYSLTLIPEAGPDGGMGMRGMLGAYAYGCVGLSGLVSLVAYSGRGLFRPWRVVASAGFAAVGIVAVVLVAELWFPPIVHARNIDATTTQEPAPATAEPRLDGSISWGSATMPESATDWYPTEGGLLATTQDGLHMIDPHTGETRWVYNRYDVVGVGSPQISADGSEIAVSTRRRTTSTLVHPAREARYVWVFDTTSGELLSESLAPALSSTLRGYIHGLLIWEEQPNAEEGRDRGWLGATRPGDDTLVWETELPQFCGPSIVRALPGAAANEPGMLATAKCKSANTDQAWDVPPMLLRVNTEDGSIEWAWRSANVGSLRLGAADAKLDEVLPVQVASDTVASVGLAGIDLATGAERWHHASVDIGVTSRGSAARVLGFDTDPYDHALRGAGDHVVMFSQDKAAQVLHLAGVDPATGELTWREQVVLDRDSSLTSRIGSLADGRVLVVARLRPDGEPAALPPDYGPPPDSNVVVTTIDAENGEALNRGGTTLDWASVQVLPGPGGVILRQPQANSDVLIALS